MISEQIEDKSPFEILFSTDGESIEDWFDSLIDDIIIPKPAYSVGDTKKRILKCAFAVLCKHVIEEAHGNYPYTDFQELIRETNLKQWQRQSWYLFGAEGIKWEEDYEFNEDPFELMMEDLIKRYVYWWSEYIRKNLNQEERIAIFAKLLDTTEIPINSILMQALNFYIRPIL